MDNFSKGCSLYFQEKYDSARDAFTAVIDESGTAINYLARAKTFMALNEYEDAYDDSNEAIHLDKSMTAAYKIKGESAFLTKEYETALQSFKIVLDLVEPKEKDNIKRWIRKCESELDDKVEMEEVQPNEVQKQDNKPILENQIEKKEESIPILQEKVNPNDLLPKLQIYHNYYQSVENLTINILGNDMKNVSRENFDVNIKPKSFSFIAKLEGKTDYKWDFEFFEDIVPSKTKINYFPSKIEIVCYKEKHLTWPTLEKSTKIVRPPVADANIPKYPSPYAKKKDWDSLAKEQEKDELKEKEEGDGLNLFFQQLYGKADPETRKAMNKSFETSGGTVLSTNWKEVKEKNYENEIKPPDGLTYKKNL